MFRSTEMGRRLVYVWLLASLPAHGWTQTFEAVPNPSPSTVVNPPDARSLGLGGAYTAVAEGAAASWWNPGALGIMPGLHLMPLSYRKWDHNFGDDINFWTYSAGAALGFEHFGLGVYYNHLDFGLALAPTPSGVEKIDVAESSLYLAAGVDASSLFRIDRRRFAWGIGATLKRANISFGREDVSGWAVDLGTLLVWKKAIALRERAEDGYVSGRFGLDLRNAFANDIEKNDGGKSEIARSVRFGFAFDSGFRKVERFGHLFGALVAVEGRVFLGELSKHDPFYSVGVETRFVDLVAYRVGVERDTQSNNTGVHYGVGLGNQEMRWGHHIVGVRLEFASVDSFDRAEHYEVSGSFSF